LPLGSATSTGRSTNSAKSSRCSFPHSATHPPPAGSFSRHFGATKIGPMEIITDLAGTYPAVLEELLPTAYLAPIGMQQWDRI
jgi:hypothetical protein